MLAKTEAVSTIFSLAVGSLPHHLLSFAEDGTPMKSFESIFNIPLEHRLVLVRSQSLGGETPSDQWDHEERDHRGRLIARYQSFVERDPVMGTTWSGWYRYDADGFLTDWEEDLPGLGADLVA